MDRHVTLFQRGRKRPALFTLTSAQKEDRTRAENKKETRLRHENEKRKKKKKVKKGVGVGEEGIIDPTQS